MLKLEKGTFSIVPIKMLKGLPPLIQVVFMWLCHHANDDGICWPSIEILCEECNCGHTALTESTNKLVELGYIIKNYRRNSSCKYQIVIKNVDNNKLGTPESGNPEIRDPRNTDLGTPDSGDLGRRQTASNYNHITKTNKLKPLYGEQQQQPQEDLKIKKQKITQPPIPYQQIADLYNETFKDEMVIYVKKLSATRKVHIRKRWDNELPTIEDWGKYFLKIKKSDFLCGRNVQEGRRPFYADFDWVINESNCLKILEDKYSNVRYDQ